MISPISRIILIKQYKNQEINYNFRKKQFFFFTVSRLHKFKYTYNKIRQKSNNQQKKINLNKTVYYKTSTLIQKYYPNFIRIE